MSLQQRLIRAHNTGFTPLARQKQRFQPLQPTPSRHPFKPIVLRIFPPDSPQRRRCREHGRDGVFSADTPERRGIRGAYGFAFVEDGGGAGEEGPVQDVRVPDYPADVGGAEHDVAGAADGEGLVDGQGEADEVAGCGAGDAFGGAFEVEVEGGLVVDFILFM